MLNVSSVGLVEFVLSPRVFKRNLGIALAVGSLLTLANQYEQLLRTAISVGLIAKISLNFAVPFVVSSISAYANRCATSTGSTDR